MQLTGYPFNLANDTLGDVAEVYLPGLDSALAALTERERLIVKQRYEDGMTFKALGEIHGVTRERIRQILCKAVRKLRHPTRANLFRAVSVSELQMANAKYQKLLREYELLNEAYEAISASYSGPGSMPLPVQSAITLSTPIYNLDLSVRSYNCLRRAGKNTLGEVADMTIDELKLVRNLGRKSAEEIIFTVKRYGLEMRGGKAMCGRPLPDAPGETDNMKGARDE